MDRKKTTKVLTEILINDRLSDRKYYAKEVTLDYGTNHPKRIDVMQFDPPGVLFPSDIEKGNFICYEIKSCIEDVYSGNGLNFYGEKNYIVTTMNTWKKLSEDIRNGKLNDYLINNHPESSHNYGVLIPIPNSIDLRATDEVYKEFETPTELNEIPSNWKLWTAMPCREGVRIRSITELLFCMLRAKHNTTNTNNKENK